MRRRAGLALLALGGLLGLVVSGVAGSPDPFEALGLVRFDSGIRAPHFTLPDTNGAPVSLSSPSGSTAVVVFWGTW